RIYTKILKIIEIGSGKSEFIEKSAGINNLLEDNELNLLVSPLVRKTNFYISRHALDVDRTGMMLYNDVISAAEKLKRFFESTGWV
ncbi:MAG TPA: hypothetical protein PK514_12840, partial [Spirochaetota bacterium]|nr:hypothetical protein [Spirochaetota bacterium]